jgi:hypothetical protein
LYRIRYNPCRMKTHPIILALFLALSIQAAAQGNKRLVPQAPEGHFEMGREYIDLSNDSIRIELGFDGIFDDFFIFDVVVHNQTGHPFPVDPAGFCYVILDSAEAENSPLPPFRSTPPERILSRYSERIREGENHREINTIFGLIEGGINLLADASAFLTTEDPFYIVDAVLNSVGTAGHYVTRDLAISWKRDLIGQEKEVVRAEILQKGELPPEKVVSGFVFFPVYDEPGFLMFCIPVDNQMFQFVYRQ